MVGSSASIADPNIVLNTIVAETLCQAADILEKADDFELALHASEKPSPLKMIRIWSVTQSLIRSWRARSHQTFRETWRILSSRACSP